MMNIFSDMPRIYLIEVVVRGYDYGKGVYECKHFVVALFKVIYLLLGSCNFDT